MRRLDSSTSTLSSVATQSIDDITTWIKALALVVLLMVATLFTGTGAAQAAVQCTNVSVFNNSSLSGYYTATLFLDPTNCTTAPRNMSGPSLADQVTTDAPVIGTSEKGGNGVAEYIKFRWKSGGNVSNVRIDGGAY